MKRQIFNLFVFVAVFMLWLSGHVRAQGSLRMGVKGGSAIASLKGDAVDNLDARIGIIGGLSLTFMITKTIGVQPEILYTRKGATTKYGKMDMSYCLNYVEIPLLLRLSIPNRSIVKPWMIAGPTFGFNTTAMIKVKGYGSEEKEDFEDEVKNTEFSLAFGVGLDINLPKSKTSKRPILLLDARYMRGLTNIEKKGADDVKDSTFIFMLGMAFY